MKKTERDSYKTLVSQYTNVKQDTSSTINLDGSIITINESAQVGSHRDYEKIVVEKTFEGQTFMWGFQGKEKSCLMQSDWNCGDLLYDIALMIVKQQQVKCLLIRENWDRKGLSISELLFDY